MMDGGFFGMGWGFGSIGTIIPLFVSHMTTSALLIGLIPAIHAVGWQLPQLFMANSVSRLRRYKPMVMLMTIQERLPFLGLALVALFLGKLGNRLALVLTFALLVWQGLGAGFTANAWQSMIAKIIPSDWRGTFFGAQAAIVEYPDEHRSDCSRIHPRPACMPRSTSPLLSFNRGRDGAFIYCNWHDA